jgi:hypothetical protein
LKYLQQSTFLNFLLGENIEKRLNQKVAQNVDISLATSSFQKVAQLVKIAQSAHLAPNRPILVVRSSMEQQTLPVSKWSPQRATLKR